jgi:hypothetical protein
MQDFEDPLVCVGDTYMWPVPKELRSAFPVTNPEQTLEAVLI